jgi:hypothetical protein
MKDHATPILYAIKSIEADGHPVFARLLSSFLPDLIRGTDKADNDGPNETIYVKVHWTCTDIGVVTVDLGNLASFSHYYDPDTGQGLNLSGWGSVEGFVDYLGSFGGILFLGGIWFDASVFPPLDFTHPYPNAADRCEEHYQSALRIWRGEEPAPHGYPWADAMFHLGWACHFLADLCVSAHTASDTFQGHQAYEDFLAVQQALGMALPPDAPGNLHIHSVGTDADYGTGISAHDLAVEVAVATHDELPLYNDRQWYQAARAAIPRAEIATARLLMKFLTDVHASEEPSSLRVRTHDRADGPLPATTVFYRLTGQPWSWTVTDAEGLTHLAFPRGASAQVRPARPGYSFTGRYSGTGSPQIPEFPEWTSPVPYRHDPSPLTETSIQLELDRTPLHLETISRVILPPGAFPAPPTRGPRGAGQPESEAEPARAVAVAERTQTVQVADLTMRAPVPLVAAVAGDPITQAMAQRVQVDVLDGPDGRPPALIVGAGTPARLGIRLFDAVGLPGVVLSTRADFEQAAGQFPGDATLEQVRATRRRLAGMQLRATREAQVLLDQAPRVVDRGDVVYAQPMLQTRHDALAQLPVLLLPTSHAHHVHVEVDSSDGFAGYATTPGPSALDVVAEPGTTPIVRVFPGGQAGPLRIIVTVRPTDEEALLAQRTVDLMVQPADTGSDVAAPLPPILRAE